MRRRRLALVLLVLAASCDERLLTESGRVVVEVPDLYVGPLQGMDASHPVLSGTRLCPTLRLAGGDLPDPDVTACYAPEAEGAGVVDADGCLVAGGVGAVVWRFAPRRCAVAGFAPRAEQVTLTVVAPGEVRPSLSSWPEDWADLALQGDFPAGWGDLDAGPLRLAVGGTYIATVELRAEGTPVAWNPGGAAWTLDPVEGRPPVVVPAGDGQVQLTALDASRGDLRLSLGESSWAVAELRGVPRGDLSSVEVVAAYGEGEGGTVPVGARAVVRDREGAFVLAAPVTWSVRRGDLSVSPGAGLPSQDYATLADGCRAPGDAPAATLRAELGGLAGEAALSWEGRGERADPETCLSGRGCDAAPRPGPPSPWALAAVLAWGLAARWRGRAAFAAAALAGALAGCGPEATIVATRELGPLRWTEAVAGRDGGYSTLAGDRSVWFFGDSIMKWAGEDGSSWRNNTACSTTDLDASDGVHPFDEPVDSLGVPGEVLPMTDDEVAFEAEHDGPGCGEDCEGIALWPGAPVYDAARGRLLVFYAKLFQRPGFLNVTYAGTSVAIWEDGAPAPVRPEVRPGEDEPTLLFGPDEVELAAGALVEGDHVYAFVCGNELKACGLAKAPLDSVAERDAWRFYAGAAGWVDDPARVTTLFHGSGMLTVHWNARVGRYLAFYSGPFGSNEVAMRTAPALTGPWSHEAVVHRGVQPVPDAVSYGALAHPELAREGGRFEYVSYYLDHDGTIRLVEVELD